MTGYPIRITPEMCGAYGDARGSRLTANWREACRRGLAAALAGAGRGHLLITEAMVDAAARHTDAGEALKAAFAAAPAGGSRVGGDGRPPPTTTA